MTLTQKIISIYPELENICTQYPNPPFILQDDSNGLGQYIKMWSYSQPQPTQEQLDAIND